MATGIIQHSTSVGYNYNPSFFELFNLWRAWLLLRAFFLVYKGHFTCVCADCVAGQLCFSCSDIHSDCSTIRRVSKPDPQSLDVWKAVHVL